MTALLLDEMLSNVIAEQLHAKGHDVLAVVADPALAGLADNNSDLRCSRKRFGHRNAPAGYYS